MSKRRRANQTQGKGIWWTISGLILVLGTLLLWGPHVQAQHMGNTGAAAAPAQGRPSWLHSDPQLANKIVHWRQYEYNSAPDRADPANGKMLVGDIWEQLGADGTPTLFHAWYTYLDGTFHQEIYETPQISVIVQGKDYTPPDSGGIAADPLWCVSQSKPASQDDLLNRLPLFVNAQGLADAGFVKSTGRPTHELPATPILDQVASVDVYHAAPELDRWTETQPVSNTKYSRVVTLNTDARGRVVFQQWQIVDEQNNPFVTTWLAYGDFLVYSAKANIPETVTSKPQIAAGGCDR